MASPVLAFGPKKLLYLRLFYDRLFPFRPFLHIRADIGVVLQLLMLLATWSDLHEALKSLEVFFQFPGLLLNAIYYNSTIISE